MQNFPMSVRKEIPILLIIETALPQTDRETVIMLYCHLVCHTTTYIVLGRWLDESNSYKKPTHNDFREFVRDHKGVPLFRGHLPVVMTGN